MKIHSKIKPFECTICGGRYSRSSTLKIHSYTHLAVKPYKCTFTGCNRRFTEKGNMQVHLKTHYKELKRNRQEIENDINVQTENDKQIKDSNSNNPMNNVIPINNDNNYSQEHQTNQILLQNNGITNECNNYNMNVYNCSMVNIYNCIYPFPYQMQSQTICHQPTYNSSFGIRNTLTNNGYGNINQQQQRQQHQTSYMQNTMMFRYGLI